MDHFSSLIVCLLVASLLLVSSWGKVTAGRAANARHLATYRILPHRLVRSAALTLPCVEVTLAIALLTGFEPAWTDRAASILFVVFGVAMASALIRVGTTPCGCFGTLRASDTSWVVVGRNCVIAVLLWVVANRSQAGFVGPFRWGPGVAGLAMVFGVVVVLQIALDARSGARARLGDGASVGMTYRSELTSTHFGGVE